MVSANNKATGSLSTMHESLLADAKAQTRFWAKVATNTNGACWPWLACRTSNGGYGKFRINGKTFRAHRVAYILQRGDIPNGMTLDHLCRNTACVNPAHLEVVTSRDNTIRGIGPAAQHARATQCCQGHQYDLINTVYRKNGQRDCRTCKLVSQRAYDARQSGVEGRRPTASGAG